MRLVLRRESDGRLTDRLQRGAFDYIRRYTNPANGLVADTSRPESPCSIAVVGFALSCYLVAVERGWLSRSSAARRVLTTLLFFWRSTQGVAADATGFKGFYYHFLNMDSGKRVWDCELSLIDSALLMAGVLSVGQYFARADPTENSIRVTAEALYRRVDWRWAQNESATLSQGWHPDYGFLHYGWEGYNEALLSILGLVLPCHFWRAASPTGRAYRWNACWADVVYSGPLFRTCSPRVDRLWGIRDVFMREKVSDRREYAQRCRAARYADATAGRWATAVTSGASAPVTDRPPLYPEFAGSAPLGYMARGVPFGPDDGTLCPWAMLATLPFTPGAALSGTRALLSRYPQVCREDRFTSGFNPTENSESGGWLSEGWYGLDQGLLVLMIENARTGLVWSLLRGCAHVRRGLKRAGFRGGWL
jgi:hypothetical protein